jgi:hypothetical protein
MSTLALSGLLFVLTLGGIFLGTLLRRALPEHDWCRPDRDNSRTYAQLTYHRCKEAKAPDPALRNAAMRRLSQAPQPSGTIFAP